MADGTLKHAKEMIGHKTLRMADRYSYLEAARKNVIQDNLAAHYATHRTVFRNKETHSGHLPEIRHKARKKDSKYSLEILIFLMVELEGIEPTTS